MRNKRSAFNLIELLVIMGITGILAAIAVPQYKRYVITAHLTEAAEVVQHYMNESVAYAADHGAFGNAYNLGLSNDPDDFYLLNDALATNAIPYYLPGAGSGIGFNGFDACGDVSNVLIYLDPEAIGMSDTDTLYLQCFMWHSDNLINKKCTYAYGGVNGSGTDTNLIPGWTNENTTSGWDQSNWYDLIINQPSFVNRTCQ